MLQDYHWWWRSFLTSGFTAVYLAAYCVHFFTLAIISWWWLTYECVNIAERNCKSAASWAPCSTSPTRASSSLSSSYSPVRAHRIHWKSMISGVYLLIYYRHDRLLCLPLVRAQDLRLDQSRLEIFIQNSIISLFLRACQLLSVLCCVCGSHYFSSFSISKI